MPNVHICDYLIRNAELADVLLQRHRDKRSTEQAAWIGVHTRHARHELIRLAAEIALIDDGCGPRDGTSAEHWDLLQRPEVRALNLARPGLATIRAYRARLVAQREAELAKV